nr:maleylpyruvate isomerase N-terminal domain-containing protein [Mycobacterium uberis]
MVVRSLTQLDEPDVLAGLFAVWDSIDALLAGLPQGGCCKPTPLLGWNVQAVVAHTN